MKFNKYQVDAGKLSILLPTVRKSKYENFTFSAVNHILLPFHGNICSKPFLLENSMANILRLSKFDFVMFHY